jgi:hypothetical protein
LADGTHALAFSSNLATCILSEKRMGGVVGDHLFDNSQEDDHFLKSTDLFALLAEKFSE